jgi:hypothetical protein
MRTSRRLFPRSLLIPAVLLLLVGAQLDTVALAAQVCPGGQFVVTSRVGSGPEYAPSEGEIVTLVAGGDISLGEGCPTTPVKLVRKGNHTVVRARWATNEAAWATCFSPLIRSAHLKGKIDGASCDHLSGKLSGRRAPFDKLNCCDPIPGRGHPFKGRFTADRMPN